jgi:hypothetical protein
MHPQVQRAGSGSCPICGMALEPPMTPAEGDTANPELRDMGSPKKGGSLSEIWLFSHRSASSWRAWSHAERLKDAQSVI